MNEFFSISLQKLSIINFIWLIFLGVLLFVSIRVAKNYLFLLLVKSPIKRKKISVKIPVFEILLWVLYAMHVVYVLILPFPFLGILILCVIIYLTRKELNNILQGLIFRFKGTVELNEKITLNDKEGRIESFNLFDVYFENKEGEIEVLPYTELNKKSILKKDFSSEFFSYKFTLQVSKEDVTIKQIENKILALPWSSSTHPPRVQHKDETESAYDVLVYAIDKRYFSFIEDDLRNFYARKV